MKNKLLKLMMLLLVVGVFIGILVIKFKSDEGNNQVGNEQGENEQVDNQQPSSVTISGWVIAVNGNEVLLQEGAFESPKEVYQLTISDDTIIYNNPKSMQKINAQVNAGTYIIVNYVDNAVDKTSSPIKIDEVVSVIKHLSEGLIMEGEITSVGEYSIKVKSGVTYTVSVSEDTIIYKDGSEIDLSSVQVGQHARVLYKGGVSMTAPPSISEVAKIVVS